VFLGHRDELDAHAFSRRNVLNDGGTSNFAFLHREQDHDRRSHGGRIGRLDEETADVQVADAGNVLITVILPRDPHAFWSGNPRIAAVAPRRGDGRGCGIQAVII
jgi:hypothetical protein